ncbi:MAG: pantoate--beta-alanine ligase, partial [Thermomicrobiales bacterium]
PDERERALALSRALVAMSAAARAGTTAVDALLAIGQAELDGSAVEYLAIVDPVTLEPVADIANGARALVAARVGPVRLIDTHDLREPFPVPADVSFPASTTP